MALEIIFKIVKIDNKKFELTYEKNVDIAIEKFKKMNK